MPTANKLLSIPLSRTGTPGAWEHFAGNPLDLALRFADHAPGNTFTGAATLRIELHPDRLINPERAALALIEITTPTGTTARATFTAPQMNQDLQGQPQRAFWLCVHATYADEDVADQTFGLGVLTLLAHPASSTVADPPPLSSPATQADLEALEERVAELEENGGGGGGGGTGTDLTATASPTGIVVASSSGTDATLAAASTTNAGLLLPAEKTKLNALSGTNTGDQTTITGNAGTATALHTARTINGTSFDGTANITITASATTLTGAGTGVTTALAANVGSAGAFVVNGGALGTPSGGNGSNLTALNGSNISTGTVAEARIDSALARLANPTFTGTPAAPTAAPGTNTTQVATTAFVTAAVAAGGGGGGGGSPGGSSGQIQGNSSGSFAGIPGTAFDGTSGAITHTQTALGTTTSPSLTLKNSTAATSGATKQVSPSTLWEGEAWKSDATAVTNTVGIQAFCDPTTFGPYGYPTWKMQGRTSGSGSTWTDLMSVDYFGNITALGFQAPFVASRFYGTGGISISSTANIAQRGVSIGNLMEYGWASGAAGNSATLSNDTILGRRGAANIRQGAADAAAPVAQTSSVQSVSAGTSNTAGQPRTYAGSGSTGNAAGGDHVFTGTPPGSSGTAQNAQVELFRAKADANKTFVFSGPATLASFTVATVPAASTAARSMIWVSDESGGACAAVSDGTNWKRFYDNANIS